MSERNQARIRYDREALLATLQQAYPAESIESHEATLNSYETKRRRGKDKPCQSQVHHGPGHQSTTFCQQIGGVAGHDVSDGKNFDGVPAGTVIHAASLPSGGFAEWDDSHPYADYY